MNHHSHQSVQQRLLRAHQHLGGNQTAQMVPADPNPGVSEHGTLRVGEGMKSISAHCR